MEPPLPPPPSATVGVTTPTHLGYADSVDSSPRSRNTDWDEPPPQNPSGKLRLMCSYGGHIVPRPHDKSLCYIGGETRIMVVDRLSSLSELSSRLSRSLLNGRSFSLKYQLPNEDLDSLISVTTDEDLDNMIEEYDRTSTSSSKPSRLRLFLFPSKPDSGSSIGSLGSLLDDSKSETWFVDALNGSGIMPRDSASVNSLLGLDDAVHVDSSSVDVEAQNESLGNNNKQVKHGQDVHSVPDSPMLETTSSFGSASSSPSLHNLPPIRVHVEDGGGFRLQEQKVGFEEHFSQMNIAAAAAAHKQDESFVVLSSLPTIPTTVTASAAAAAAATMVSAVTINSTAVASETPNRVFSDDERSDHGAPGMLRKPPQPPPQQQLQQKPSVGLDFPSSDSVIRDNNVPNAISRPKPIFYQDPLVQVASRDTRVSANPPIDPKSNFSDQSYRIQMQQVQDSGYVISPPLDQQQQQQQQPQQQQFFHPGAHYIHHHATGPVPISSYYQMYPPQQQQQQHQHQLDQQYQMYYLPVRQNQPQNPTMVPPTAAAVAGSVYPTRTAPSPKPELAANVYRTAAAAAAAPPQLVHMSPDQYQQQYMGYHQIHHPSQSTTATANYPYEFADPAHNQIYYTQPQATSLPPQYQTMTSAAAVAMSEASTQLPTENSKLQIRASQPL